MSIVKAENARKDIPLVSIIAVCYNHAKFVVETLDSILNQSYENIELVIIDANSPDKSAEVIRDWIERNQVDCTFIEQTEPRNVCQNLNEGLSIISGKYYQGLSCDDVLLEDKIACQVRIFEQDQEIGVVFGNAGKIDEHSKKLTQLYASMADIYAHHINGSLQKHIRKVCLIPAPSVLIRTKCAMDIGPYDEEIGYEDWDFWIRISKTHWKFHFEYKIFVLYRILNTSLWDTNSSESLLSVFKVMEKHNLFSYSYSLLWYFDLFGDLPKTERKKVNQYLKQKGNTKLLMIYKAYCIFGNTKNLKRAYKYLILR
jgi:glycosyltransferase involved in cell wall biosynthesis